MGTKHAAAMVALVIALCVLTIGLGERIGINYGLGWDGALYGTWASQFPNEVLDKGTTIYHAQRVLPSGVVWWVMKLAGARVKLPAIVDWFQYLDALLLVVASGFWAHLCLRMRWRAAASWVGFAGLFLGFANARHALYNPVLTDTSAFTLGMVMAWAYLLRHPIALWVCALLAVATWPALTAIACVLLVLRRLDAPLPEPSPRWALPIRGMCVAIATIATVYFLVTAAHYLRFPVQELGIPKFADMVPRRWLPLTTVTLAAFLVTSWYVVMAQPALWNPVALVRAQRWLHVALAVAGVAIIWYVRREWIAAIGTQGKGPPPKQFTCLVTLEALRGPLWGLVHHVVYFGPIIVVAALRWRDVCRAAAGWGHGAALALAMLVVFAAASESRQWIHLLPLLVAATVAATDERWTVRRLIVFVVLALVWSKLWLVIGYKTPGDTAAFPNQSYFMHLGPWASNLTYYVHGGIAVATAIALWFALRVTPRAPT